MKRTYICIGVWLLFFTFLLTSCDPETEQLLSENATRYAEFDEQITELEEFATKVADIPDNENLILTRIAEEVEALEAV